MASQQAADEVAADVTADRDHEPGQDAPGTVRCGQHQGDERRHQRQVHEGEHPSGHVAQVTCAAPGHAPGQDGDHRHGQRGEQGPLTAVVRQAEHDRAPGGHRDQRQPDATGLQGAGQFPHPEGHDRGHVDQERDFHGEQGDQRQGAQDQADRYCGPQVTASPGSFENRGGRGRRLRGWLRGREWAARTWSQGPGAARLPGPAVLIRGAARGTQLIGTQSQTSRSSASLCRSSSSTCPT